MKLCDFIQLMFHYIGYGKGKADFVLYLFSLFLRDPATEQESEDDEHDTFNPLSGLTQDAHRKIFNGKRGIKLSASQLHRIFSKTGFIDALACLSDDARMRLIEELSVQGFKTTDAQLDEYCADIFLKIIECGSDGKTEITPEMIPVRDDKGNILSFAPGMSAYIKDGKLYISGDAIDLPSSIEVPDTVQSDELPYIKAVFDAYSDTLNMSVELANIGSLSPRYQMDFTQQRKAYYSIESVERGLRDIYPDSDKQFQILEQDAYDGIYEVYVGDYKNGYERLRQVLIKITNTTLDKSTLSHIKNLIGNLEKKGLCHLLVNDGIVHSWVNIDE